MAVGGPRSRKRNRTGTGTSRTDSSGTASWRRTKAMEGWSRKPTLPGETRATTLRHLHDHS